VDTLLSPEQHEPVSWTAIDVTDREGTPLQMWVPETDTDDPEISIVVPALNERINIAEFIAWCHQGLRAAGVRGEILIVDSSSDDTPRIAARAGARVLRVPKRGLGRAYIDAVPFIRAPWIVMGDADCTYDFRELAPFVDRFRAGDEFIMGSRYRGSIEKGAMPPHHQYFGTPFTTWILNRVYSSRFSDIHCGMRGITLDALRRIDLESQSWEYASEMVLKSVHHQLRTGEVPVTFLKDRNGRVSHHRRMGWFSPFQAAWINLRAMFVYGADFFLLRPGLLFLLVGLLVMLPVSFGPVSIGPIGLSLTWQFVGAMAAIVGLQGVLLGCVAQVFFDYTGRRTDRLTKWFHYTRNAAIGAGLVLLGLVAVLPLASEYLANDLKLDEITWRQHLAVTGLFSMVAGFSLFVFTLLMHGVAIVARKRTLP
jgi:glycosyltransferase involved in cell wall biosynthesis